MKGKLVLALSGCALVAAISAAAWHMRAPTPAQPESPALPAALEEREYAPPAAHEGDPAGMRKYENTAFHFSLAYPENLRVREYKEAGGAMSATFEDAAGEQGFQIYVTPYAGTEITRERFLLDSPAGVMQEATNIVIDGTPATMFFGKHSLMGDTREVWFIKDGYLYEVATYKALDEWLSQVMATWKFI